MDVIASVAEPADIGFVNKIDFSATATPTSPDATPGEVDSASITTGRVDGDIFLEGRDIDITLGGTTKTMRVLDLDRSGSVETSASLTGPLARFVTGDLTIPPMQNGAVGAAIDYAMQKTGEMRVSNQYAAGASTNMLCASLRGHSALFDVASGAEVRPFDESSLKIVGQPWRPSQDYRQNFHTHFETYVDDSITPYVATPWDWSGRPIFGNLDLDGEMRHVIKFIAKKASYSSSAVLSARLGTSVAGTGTAPTIDINMSFLTRKVYVSLKDRTLTSASYDIDVDPSIDMNQPFVFAMSFQLSRPGSLSRLNVSVATSKLDGTASSVNDGGIFVGDDFPRIGGVTQAPLAMNYILARTLVYDKLDPSWTDWWRLKEQPTSVVFEGNGNMGGPVRHHTAPLWDYLSQVLSTYGYEIRTDSNVIVVSPTGSRRIEIESTGQVERNSSRPEVSAYDVVYLQNTTRGYPSFTLAYSREDLGEVGAGEFAYSTDSLRGEFHYLYQPDMSGVEGNPSKSVYNVVDADGKFVSSKVWIEAGGYVRVRISDDLEGVQISIAGPVDRIEGYLGPYTIKNLKVSGSGFATQETSMRIHTGVPRAVGNESVPSISPPTAMGVNAVAQIASKMNNSYSVQEEISFECNLFPYEELNGQSPVGAIFEFENRDYRITSFEHNDLYGSITARPHTTIRRVADHWGNMTLGELSERWGLSKVSFRDISKTILKDY